MKAWAKRRWPTLIVAFAISCGFVLWAIMLMQPDAWMLLPPASSLLVKLGPFFLALFPFGFLPFFGSILPGTPGSIITACIALFTLAVVDDVDRKSRRGGFIAVGIYLALCVYLILEMDSIWLWGTAIRRVCYVCGSPID